MKTDMSNARGLDGRLRNPYLCAGMNRFLLTLLALVTGLVAQVSPAQAAVGASEAQVGSVQLARGAVLLARQVTIRAVRESGFESDAGLTEAAPLPRFQIALSGIRIGIDRARE